VDLQGHASSPPSKSGNKLNPRISWVFCFKFFERFRLAPPTNHLLKIATMAVVNKEIVGFSENAKSGTCKIRDRLFCPKMEILA